MYYRASGAPVEGVCAGSSGVTLVLSLEGVVVSAVALSDEYFAVVVDGWHLDTVGGLYRRIFQETPHF